MRGWGRGLREAVGKWYAMPAGKLALQAVKYQQRDGWAHRDLLRLAHPKPITPVHEIIYGWMVNGWEWVGEMPHPDQALVTIWAFERAKRVKSAGEVIELVRKYDLPREAIPTEWLNSVEVWEALLAEMPLEAMTRNLAKMTTVGLLSPNSEAVRKVVAELAQPRAHQEGSPAPHKGAGGPQDLRPGPRRARQAALDARSTRS